MQINKTIKGEKFRYHVQPKLNTMLAEIKWFHDDEPIIGNISPDFKYIFLPENFTQQISGLGKVKVGKLKLSKRQQWEVMEYNGIDPFKNK